MIVAGSVGLSSKSVSDRSRNVQQARRARPGNPTYINFIHHPFPSHNPIRTEQFTSIS